MGGPMGRLRPALYLCGIISLGFVIGAWANEASNPPKRSGAWNAKMQGLYLTLSELMTNVTSDKRFNDPKLKSKIRSQAEKLSKIAHDLGDKATQPDLDPTLSIIGGMLKQETEDAVLALKRGHTDYARSILRTLPSYCISCHTRNASGVQFKELALEPTEKSLSPLEKGEFFAATRQFDRALAEYRKVIQDPKAPDNDHWTWKRTVEEALAIAVRTKKDPKLSEEIVDSVINAKGAPVYIREDAKQWKKSIQEWVAEKPLSERNEDSLRLEAMRLMSKAKSMQQYMMDRTADVAYLRASSAVHDLLQVAKNSRTIADALFMAGLSYEVLNPLKRDNLHQIYYEACVRKQPHTELSELCYRRFEENVVLGYTGSAGTSVPETVRERMRRLEALSTPLEATPKPRH